MRSSSAHRLMPVVLLLMLVLQACVFSPAERAIRKGDELRGTEQYEDAIRQYRFVIEQYPRDRRIVTAYLKMGDVYLYNLNDTDMAQEQYDEVIKRRPLSRDALTAYERRVEISTKNGKLQAAIDNLSLILRYFPDEPRRNAFHHELAKNYIRMENPYQAQIELKEILNREDLDLELKPQVLFDLAEAYYMSGKLDEAEKYYRQVIQDYPDSSDIFNAKWGLSHCLEESGDLKGAMQIQEELKKEKNPKDGSAGGLVGDKLIDTKLKELKKRERSSGRVIEDKLIIKQKK